VIVVNFQQLDIQGFGAAGTKSVHAMGCIFSREAADQGDIRDTIQAREIDKRIAQQSTAEKKVQKLLLLGAGESGKSTIFKQIKVLFQTGFDDSEKKNYTSVVHANAYQSIKVRSSNQIVKYGAATKIPNFLYRGKQIAKQRR
jgi:chloramphenicol 3-O-phosphotransferase